MVFWAPIVLSYIWLDLLKSYGIYLPVTKASYLLGRVTGEQENG
jgi:hypothetical protein